MTAVDCGASQSVNAILATLPAGSNTVEVSVSVPRTSESTASTISG